MNDNYTSDMHAIRRYKAQRKKIIVWFSTFFAVAVFFVMLLFIFTLSYDRIYAGVYLDGIDVSGMTKQDVENMINSKYDEMLDNAYIRFTSGGRLEENIVINVKELSIEYKTQEIVDALFTPGHEGSVLKRFKDILNLSSEDLNIPLFNNIDNIDADNKLIAFNDAILEEKINEIINNTSSSVKEHNIIKDDEAGVLKIIPGKQGLEIDRAELKKAILKAAGQMDTEYIELDKVSTVNNPGRFDANQIHDLYNIKPQNASYKWEDSTRRNIIITPAVRGEAIDILDLSAVEQTIDTQDAKDVYIIPIKFKDPDIIDVGLTEPTFNETIGKGSTSYSSSSSARKHNIQLAASTINGYILLPGETFSFNTYVGDTTKDKGYMEGISFENGENVVTYGGGVCQVSTTLYHALLDGGLEVVKRYSHSMKVGYTKDGMDAAVAYGVKDIEFRNNFDAPIKIVATTNGKTITFEIKGINRNKTTKYSYKTDKISDFTDGGKNYQKYETFRTVTVDGKVIEKDKSFKNNISIYLIPKK